MNNDKLRTEFNMEKEMEKIRIQISNMQWKCPLCGKPLRAVKCSSEVFQCDDCGLAWRIYDVHPMTQGD
jgi:ribosomal protein L37AE/L43A